MAIPNFPFLIIGLYLVDWLLWEMGWGLIIEAPNDAILVLGAVLVTESILMPFIVLYDLFSDSFIWLLGGLGILLAAVLTSAIFLKVYNLCFHEVLFSFIKRIWKGDGDDV